MSIKLDLFRPAALAAAITCAAGAPAGAYQATQRFNQPEQRTPTGQVQVEASVITVIACNGAGENGGQYYIYQYLNRAGFRAIQPPNWGSPLGGHDWTTFEQAAGTACGTMQAPPPPPPPPVVPAGVNGQWRLTSTCTWTPPTWSSSIYLSQAADGTLTGSTSNDALNTSIVTIGGPDSWQTTVPNRVSGSAFSLVLHPAGWVSVLELTGTVYGSSISGKVHHYSTDDCTFSMTR